MFPPRTSFVLPLVSALALACGANDTSLFDTPPATTTTDASTPPADGGKPDATLLDSSAPDTSAPDTSVPDTSVPDTSPPPGASIKCGNSACTNPPQVCCRTGFQNPYQYACTSNPKQDCANPQNGSVAIACTAPSQCPNAGDVCCLELNQNNFPIDTVCKPTNSCQGFRMCDPNGPNVCTNGLSCQLSVQTLPGYYFCR